MMWEEGTQREDKWGEEEDPAWDPVLRKFRGGPVKKRPVGKWSPSTELLTQYVTIAVGQILMRLADWK